MTNWKKEKEALITPQERNWWNPVAGQYKIVFLTDGEEYDSEYEDKPIRKVVFDVEIEKQKYSWSMGKGRTQNSLYGQLALIGAEKGTLIGQMIQLVVKGKEKRDYIILEALPLMESKEKKVE